MADPIVTPVAESIAPVVEPANDTVASIAEPAESKAEETVPLSVFLSVKEDLKDLKRELKEASKPQSDAAVARSIKDMAEKYPDVSQDFMKDLISAAKAEAIQETEAKYTPILQQQETERKQADFDKKFDAIYETALALNPSATLVDKEVIKSLALTPKYNNTPIADIIKMLNPEVEGKVTTENDIRAAADVVTDTVDVTKVTSEQRARIMDDPKAREAYFAKLDALGQ